jgi:hypothetical protein
MVKFVFYHENGESLSKLAKMHLWDKLIGVSKEVTIIKSDDDDKLSVKEEYDLMCRYIQEAKEINVLVKVTPRLISLITQSYDYSTLRMIASNPQLYGGMDEFANYVLRQFMYSCLAALNLLTENYKYKIFSFEDVVNGHKVVCENGKLCIQKNDISYLVTEFV